MSALARYFRSRGVAVSGYDRTETPLTRQFEREGIAIHYEERPGDGAERRGTDRVHAAVPKGFIKN